MRMTDKERMTAENHLDVAHLGMVRVEWTQKINELYNIANVEWKKEKDVGWLLDHALKKFYLVLRF